MIVRLALVAILWLVMAMSSVSGETTTFVDAHGRTITLSHAPGRVVLGDSLDLLYLSFVTEDPVAAVVGWGGRGRLDPGLRQSIRKRNADVDDIADLGDPNAQGFSVEKALSLMPDVAIFSAGFSPDDGVVRQLEAAGVPVVFIGSASDDIATTRREVTTSIQILGAVFQRREAAAAFVDFYDTRLERIAALVREIPSRPKVLFEAHANAADCCWTPGSKSDYVEFAGGENIARELVVGATGQISLDYVLVANPDVVVATGNSFVDEEAGLRIGPLTDAGVTAGSLRALSQRRGFATLAARGERFHGIWHPLLSTPFNIVALEAMAGWFHPELASVLDPQTTLGEINRQFTSLPLEGVFLATAPRR